MKGKNKKKRKIGKIIMLGLSFVFTIVITATATLAWFYDSDWASNYVNMAGTVGIEIRDKTNLTTSGSRNLHFNITTDLAYPGQAIDVSASVYNNGGRSGAGGSAAYIRAHFAVFTNIGMQPDVENYKTETYPNGLDNPLYIEAKAEADSEQEMNATMIYEFLNKLIATQNSAEGTTYRWKYYQHTNSIALSTSGLQSVGDGDEIPDNDAASDIQYYLDGKTYTEMKTTGDRGYYYLCYKEGEEITTLEDETYEVLASDFILKPLGYSETAAFLWNDQFIIPWTLTNYSADKNIFIAMVFQAVQTFIPQINTNGSFVKTANNQVSPELCTYNNHSVQAVFNSCAFNNLNLKIYLYDINKDGNINIDDIPLHMKVDNNGDGAIDITDFDTNEDGSLDDKDELYDFGDATKYSSVTAPTNSLV